MFESRFYVIHIVNIIILIADFVGLIMHNIGLIILLSTKMYDIEHA